jgi:hypothetical protein
MDYTGPLCRARHMLLPWDCDGEALANPRRIQHGGDSTPVLAGGNEC